jgi:hypothetical protein
VPSSGCISIGHPIRKTKTDQAVGGQRIEEDGWVEQRSGMISSLERALLEGRKKF